ncbi:hypothetical protein G5B39_10525 [Rhodobacteraceae bacterium SC52]|nr:hypothetical protein G5B39_10525 [Rhodobacteraceae bacterium SC52]
MKRFKDFFTSDHNPRWQILLAGAVVIFTAWAQNYYFYKQQINREDRLAAQQQIEDRSAEIRRHSIDFQTYAGVFVSSVLDDTAEVNERRNALIGNIIAQDTAIDVSADVLGNEIQPQIEEYRLALRNMKTAVEQVSDVVSMGQFWAAASDLLVARNNLLQALEVYSDEARS